MPPCHRLLNQLQLPHQKPPVFHSLLHLNFIQSIVGCMVINLPLIPILIPIPILVLLLISRVFNRMILVEFVKSSLEAWSWMTVKVSAHPVMIYQESSRMLTHPHENIRLKQHHLEADEHHTCSNSSNNSNHQGVHHDQATPTIMRSMARLLHPDPRSMRTTHIQHAAWLLHHPDHDLHPRYWRRNRESHQNRHICHAYDPLCALLSIAQSTLGMLFYSSLILFISFLSSVRTSPASI